jgi:hypothetical protein
MIIWYADCVRGQTGGGFLYTVPMGACTSAPGVEKGTVEVLRCRSRVRAAESRALSRLEESYEEG